MLEAYSTNITVGDNSAIPFNNIVIKKGCTAELSAPATIQFNKAGVYMVSCDVSINPDTTGEISIQLSKNDILQPQAISAKQGTADTLTTLGFTTLVQVKESNTCNCCSSPTVVQVINGTSGDFAIANIVVTKVC